MVPRNCLIREPIAARSTFGLRVIKKCLDLYILIWHILVMNMPNINTTRTTHNQSTFTSSKDLRHSDDSGPKATTRPKTRRLETDRQQSRVVGPSNKLARENFRAVRRVFGRDLVPRVVAVLGVLSRDY